MSELPDHLSELPHQNNSNIVNDNNFFFQNFHFICFKIILYNYTIKTLKYISLSKEKHIFLAVLIQKKKITPIEASKILKCLFLSNYNFFVYIYSMKSVRLFHIFFYSFGMGYTVTL